MTHQATTSCPALFLAAPASGQGKTTITAALARYLKNQGKVVRIFKTGPDYLDPQILQQASGQPVIPLDLWMAGEDWCQQQLFEAAQQADFILVEGAMGLFDGEPSSADLAVHFNLPLAIVMDVKGMAQTAAALASGLVGFRPDINVAGLIANRCGSQRHEDLIREALPEHIPLLSCLRRSDEVVLPERHLGLVQADELKEELEQRFEMGAQWLVEADIEALLSAFKTVDFCSVNLSSVPQLLSNIRIGVAKDAAFSFIYAANLELLISMGASLTFFSPLQDQSLPPVDALWFPGGYPELYGQQLSSNTNLRLELQQFFEQEKPILAECGGLLYCLESLTDLDQHTFSMAGLLSGQGAMRGKRGCQGMQTAQLPEGDVRGHAHHRSRSANTPEPIAYCKRPKHPAPGEAIYREKQLTATYLHLFFPSNPEAIAKLFNINF